MEVVAVDARIEHVTVYARGARVRRVMTIPAPLPARVRIVGLPLSVIDDTIRVEVGGPAIATAVRAGVDAPAGDAAPEESAELRAARKRLAIAEVETERISAALELLAAAPVIEEDPSDEAPPPWSAVVSARRAVVAVRVERELVLQDALAAARREAVEAQRALEAVADRERRTGTAQAAKLHELRKFVELELVATAASEIVIRLEYLVTAARWAPSYVARIDGEQATVEVRAVVAQEAGEDWEGVPLRLSTAEPEQFALLPELAAQKIGRRQPELPKPGFRAPPVGAAALYADYERALHPRERAAARVFTSASAFEDSTYEGRPPAAGAAYGGGAPMQLAEQVWDDDSSRAKEAFHTPPAGHRLPPPSPPPAAAPAAPPAPQMMKRRAMIREEAVARAAVEAAPPATFAAPTPRLDYGSLVMAPPASPARGTLIPAPLDRRAGAIAHEVATAQARIAELALPPGCIADWAHAYDYAFATDGAVDVRADGAWHSIAVTARAGTVKLRHVAVPREQADVFRVAAIVNPFAGPLLPGPIDVYDRGKFLVTSEVDDTPPGATVEIGLGVDPTVKIARNTEFREESAGMLRGKLELHHAVTIQVENLSGRAIDLEVRERVPVTREGDDDVDVVIGRVDPPWERWTPDPEAPRDQRLRGGHRWRVAVAAGAKRTLAAAYEIKLAAKHELVGGNRRES